MILRQSIGIVLIVMGIFQGILSLRNLWTIAAAWKGYDGMGVAGIYFLGDPEIPGRLQRLWTENLIVSAIMLVAIIVGSVLLFGGNRGPIAEEE